MCQVDLNGYTFNSSEPLTGAELRYRLQGTTPWTTVIFDLNTNLTPNITQEGTYEYQLRLENSAGFGAWSSTGTFNVENCS